MHTVFFPRNPYLFSDMTGGMYVLHGPEKLEITTSMTLGSLRSEIYLKHYDSQRWPVESRQSTRQESRGPPASVHSSGRRQ